MKKLITIIIAILLIGSCGVVKPVVVRDSTVVSYNYIDSINYIDSTIYHHLYKEIYNDYTDMLDTLNLEDSYSKAQAYLDTANKKLKGSIKTKDVDIPVKIKYKEKFIYKDSIRTEIKEVPVPVEVEEKYVPKFYKWLLGINIALLLGAVLYFLKKFTKIFG